MKRQIDIDLLLPKIMKFKTSCNDNKAFSANQVLWILEQEFALQNSANNTVLDSQDNSMDHHIEMTSDIVQHSIKVSDCQNELFEIKGKMCVDELQCSKA